MPTTMQWPNWFQRPYPRTQYCKWPRFRSLHPACTWQSRRLKLLSILDITTTSLLNCHIMQMHMSIYLPRQYEPRIDLCASNVQCLHTVVFLGWDDWRIRKKWNGATPSTSLIAGGERPARNSTPFFLTRCCCVFNVKQPLYSSLSHTTPMHKVFSMFKKGCRSFNQIHRCLFDNSVVYLHHQIHQLHHHFVSFSSLKEKVGKTLTYERTTTVLMQIDWTCQISSMDTCLSAQRWVLSVSSYTDGPSWRPVVKVLSRCCSDTTIHMSYP